MDELQKISLLKKRKMAIEELIAYYSELRKYDYRNGKKLNGINMRKKIHLLVRAILKIDQLLSKEKIVILNDDHTFNNKPTIFACTHIGGNDIQRTFQVIKEPAYLMLGDPGILYKKLIYQGLKLNGVIPLETSDREDRKIAYNRSIELLQNGGNLLIYPEGAWNVSPNVLVMKIFTGTVRIAQETGADIVPIAVEQYDKTFYFNIGSNYTISKNSPKSVMELNEELREKLATLKWSIISAKHLNRDDIPSISEFQSEIIGRCNYGYGFSLEDALRESFHDKTIISDEEVFAFLENLDITPDNAFLMPQKLELKKKKN